MLDSLVYVSRQVGGATNLLAPDMWPVQRNSEETTKIPGKPINQQKDPATATSPVLLTKNGPLRKHIRRETTSKIAPPHTNLKFKNRPRLFQSHEL